MRGYDVLIVRMLPFVLYLEIAICNILSLNGVDLDDFYYLHSNSAIYASCLFLISLANHHYHCVWNRAMYVFLIVVPTINYLDEKWTLFPTEICYVIFVHTITALTGIITTYLAIRHFKFGTKQK